MLPEMRRHNRLRYGSLPARVKLAPSRRMRSDRAHPNQGN